MSKRRFLAFIDTLVAANKITQSDKPVMVLEGIKGGLQPDKEKELRKKFNLAANQFFRLESLFDTEHFLSGFSTTSLCGTKAIRKCRVQVSKYQEFPGFINCAVCLKKMEETNGN